MPATVTSAAGCAAAISGSVANWPCSGSTVVTRSPQNCLRRGEDPQLVVDEDVAIGRVAALDVVERELLVDVDEDVPVDRRRDPRRSTLCGWKTASPSVSTTVGPSERRCASTSSAPG